MTARERLPRRCPCGTRLSVYNEGSLCWPCEDRQRDTKPLAYAPYVHHPERHDPKTYQTFLEALSAITADFLAADITEAMGISSSAVSRHLLRAERDGVIARVDRRKLPREVWPGHHGWVAVWRKTEQAMRRAG